MSDRCVRTLACCAVLLLSLAACKVRAESDIAEYVELPSTRRHAPVSPPPAHARPSPAAASTLAVMSSFAKKPVVEEKLAVAERRPVELENQPVFLFCPHKESAGSWSLYVVVDKNNPTQLLALGLEELPGKNSKENTYKGVLDAQKNPGTQRNEIARLDARNFGRGRLEVQQNNMLSIGVSPEADGLHLEINARVSIDQHFIVGGSERGRRELILQYSNLNKAWVTKTTNLQDKDGRNAIGRYAVPLTGIVFTAGATSVQRICAVTDLGSAIVMMDR